MKDKRPNATIVCFRCLLEKSSINSTKFRSYHVCAECTKELRKIDQNAKNDGS